MSIYVTLCIILVLPMINIVCTLVFGSFILWFYGSTDKGSYVRIFLIGDIYIYIYMSCRSLVLFRHASCVCLVHASDHFHMYCLAGPPSSTSIYRILPRFQVASYSMFVTQIAFHARVSDPAIGGTYMTLLNTICNLGSNWPGTLALWFVDPLSSKSCEGVSDPSLDCDTKVQLEVSCMS